MLISLNLAELILLKWRWYWGNKIITGIKQYEQKYGVPPETLNSLVPEFLSEIPQTVSGNSFVYTPKDKSAYDDWTLTFDVASNDTGCTYISHLENWDCWPPGAGDI